MTLHLITVYKVRRRHVFYTLAVSLIQFFSRIYY